MKNTGLILLAAALLLFSGGCDKVSSGDGQGNLVIKVTDDPFDISSIESATVTITKVEIKKAGDGVSDGNPFVVLSEDTVTIDLINLRNGVTETLLELEIPAGEYDQIRLYVEEAGLKLKDFDESYNVKVPSGKQTGIKLHINPSIVISGGLTSEVLIDFDLSGSFVLRGNMNNNNGFIFKPCIRAANLTTAGRIEGVVTDTADVSIRDAKVWIARDSVMANAFADSLGFYAFIGVPAGTWSIFATKEGYDTVSYEGIDVIAGNKTIQDFTLTKKE